MIRLADEARIAFDNIADRGANILHPTLRLGVADSGPGIPSEARGRVLDRFVRLEEARSRPGFGLGLSLVNAVVRLHQGTLALEDHAPGLSVVITLPAGDPTGG